MASALALFGDTSYFATLRNATQVGNSILAGESLKRICRGGAAADIPFRRLGTYISEFRRPSESCQVPAKPGDSGYDPEILLLELARDYLFTFSSADGASAVFKTAMLVANEILLTAATRRVDWADSSTRSVHSGSGFEIVKPKRSIPAIIAVSVFVLVQVVGVVRLAAYGAARPKAKETSLPLEDCAADKGGRESSEQGGSVTLGAEDDDAPDMRVAGVVG